MIEVLCILLIWPVSMIGLSIFDKVLFNDTLVAEYNRVVFFCLSPLFLCILVCLWLMFLMIGGLCGVLSFFEKGD